MQAKALSQIFHVNLDELANNDIHDEPVRNVSNTEKLTGILMKILKIIGIAVIVLMIVHIISIMFYYTSERKESVTSTRFVDITCSIEVDTYHYRVEMDDQSKITQQTGDAFIKAIIKDKNFKNGNDIVTYVERYFVEHGGNCQ